MLISILLPLVCAVVFLLMANGWFWAVRAPSHRWSLWWYGRVWHDRFAPTQRRVTIVRAYGMCIVYLSLSIVFILTAVNASMPAYPHGASPRLLILFGGVLGWGLCWWYAHTIRQSHKS